MKFSFVKALAEAAEELTPEEIAAENKLWIILGSIAIVIAIILLFIYLACCIVIVKQGTRKIVERFGSYNRTLKEGIHIIFRPFDRIAPVPWNILSISERDEYAKNRVTKNTRFFNDNRIGIHHKNSLTGSQTDEAKIQQHNEQLTRYIAKRMAKDIRILTREEFIDRSEHVSEALGDTLDYDMILRNRTGRNLNELINEVLTAKNGLDQLVRTYTEIGFSPYKADKELVRAVKDKDALAASVKYYPRHQDPHSRRAGVYAMAENHVQDYVDLRERHIDTDSSRVRAVIMHRKDYVVENADPNKQDLARFDGINLITKDNASIGANVVIFFSITDPFLYYYGVDQPEESLVLLAVSAFRNIVSGLTLEEALKARSDINKKIREELDAATNNWGIKANRIEIKDFVLAQTMQEAMDDVLVAERERRANILRAEAYKKLKDEGVLDEHIRLKGYETLEEVSKGTANKVFIPNDLSQFLTGAHVVADAFKDSKQEGTEATAETIDVKVKDK